MGLANSPSFRFARRVGEFMVWTGCVVATQACVPTHEIRVNLTGPRALVVDTPRAIGAGDVVRIVAIDSVWGNRYVSALQKADIGAVDRALVHGSGTLSKLTGVFAPHERDTRSFTDDGSAPGFDRDCVQARNLDSLAIDGRIAEVNTLAGKVDSLAGAIRGTVERLTSNELAPLRAFVLDPAMHRAVHAVAGDRTAQQAAEILAAFAMDPSRSRLPSTAVDMYVQRTLEYARRVEALAALIPADSILVAERIGLAGFKRNVIEHRALVADLLARAAPLRGGACITGTIPTPAHISLTDRGEDLTPLITMPELDPARLDLALRTIVRSTELLASSVNALPRWGVGPARQIVLEQSFESNKEVSVALVRRPRYGRFEAHVTAAPPAKGASDGGDAKAEGLPALTVAREDTAAVVRFNVYPRYRFHIGAGFVYSPLRTRSYEATTDTVEGTIGDRITRTGDTPFQIFPVALLSYTLFPTAGQIYDGRVRPGWPSLERLGLAVHAGLSLNDPTEDLMFGLSTEPFPGIRFGAGYHLARVEVARGDPGTFVPASAGPALRDTWRGEWGAMTLALDATVFFNTLGALLK